MSRSDLRRVAGRLRGAVARRRPDVARPLHGADAADAVYPAVAEEHTNVGPVMDALVARMRSNQEPLGRDARYDLLRENFDHLNFLLQNRALSELRDADPIRFFLRNGADAVNSPYYNFDMRNYLERYPERRLDGDPNPYLTWLQEGRAAGEIADPGQGIDKMAEVLGLEPREVADELAATRTDMMERLRTGTLGEMFAKAVEVEPLIGAVWSETPRTRMVPLGGRFVVGQLAAIHACQAVNGFRRARIVVVTHRPQGPGGQRLEDHLATSLAGSVEPQDLVVIYTDEPPVPTAEGAEVPTGGLPEGVHEIDFGAVANGLPDEHRQQALVSLLRSYRAEAIVNVDSRLLYRVLTPYGKALAMSERLFLYFHGNEQRVHGNWDGWSMKWFYSGLDIATGILTDTAHLREQLVELYQLGDADRERIHHLPAPVDPTVPLAAPPEPLAGRRPVVHWSGRWDQQRSVDLALEVARLAPDVDFRFWAEALVGHVGLDVPANVHVAPLVRRPSALPLDGTDAWLHTAAGDGFPAALLEVAMSGLPIVGSLSGGVGEVLSAEDAWPVADAASPEAYVTVLRELLADPAQARRRSLALRERLGRERDREAYGRHAARVLLASDDSVEATR